jgi:tetratricopeptide (TPR) repeat protein
MMIWQLAVALTLGAAPVVMTEVAPPIGLEKKLVEDAKDGQLDGLKLLEAALIASGVPDDQIPLEAQRARAAMASAIAKANTQADAASRGKILLEALHETVFRKYVLLATDVADVIRTGEFNCLSSALLYVVAAEGLLEKPRAMVSPDHAFARVTVDGKTIDVETTLGRGGFDPDRSKMSEAHVRKIASGNVTVEQFKDSLKDAEELPPLSLVAAIYSNRAVALAAQGDLVAATVAVDRASRLASGRLRSRSASWRASMLTSAAKQLVEQNRLDDARRLLELGLDGVEGKDLALLNSNLANVHVRLAAAAGERSDWMEALAQVEQAVKLGSDSPFLHQEKARATAALAAAEGNDGRCVTGTGKPDAVAECLARLAVTIVDQKPSEALQYGRRALALSAGNANAATAVLLALDRLAIAAGEKAECMAVETLVHEGLQFQHAAHGQKWETANLIGSCWIRAAEAAFKLKDWDAASRGYERAGVHLGFAKVRHNLAVIDLDRGIELANQQKCDDARPSLKRAAQAEPSMGETAVIALASCAGKRARPAFVAKDFATAARELRLGLRDAPADEALLANLSASLVNLAITLGKAGRCPEARALVPELESLKLADAAKRIKKECP